MTIKPTLWAGLALAALAMPVQATNFSYSHFGIELGQLKYDDTLDFNGELYRDMGFFSLEGSYQFAENFALGFISAAAANEGRNTELTESMVGLTARFPFAVSRTMDVIPFVGHASIEAEACEFNVCGKADDSGAFYGLALRTWVVPGQFELHASYTSSSLEDLDSVVNLGGALWLQDNHRISLQFEDRAYARVTTIGYRFTWW